MISSASIVDLQAGPFSDIEDIRNEIARIRQLPPSEARDDAVEQLLEWIAARAEGQEA